ncbi:MAG: dockerin type I repeat-containing protein [candidate division Zixibacteria bacterium]|nr:dockerin type I repeat-containing protein [candidate division Zixibacteria bacterium]
MKKRIIISALTVVALLFVIHTVIGSSPFPQQPVPERQDMQLSPAGSSENFELDWEVLSCGATDGSSASFSMLGTLGQPFTGYGESVSFQLSHGFWQEPGDDGTCCNHDGIRGNVDDVGDINIADLTYLVAYLFTGGPPPQCLEETDVNGDGEINIADLTYLVSYLFTGGPPPVSCP